MNKSAKRSVEQLHKQKNHKTIWRLCSATVLPNATVIDKILCVYYWQLFAVPQSEVKGTAYKPGLPGQMKLCETFKPYYYPSVKIVDIN